MRNKKKKITMKKCHKNLVKVNTFIGAYNRLKLRGLDTQRLDVYIGQYYNISGLIYKDNDRERIPLDPSPYVLKPCISHLNRKGNLYRMSALENGIRSEIRRLENIQDGSENRFKY